LCPASDPAACRNSITLHHNPVSGKWNLVNDYTDYEHSSASFYETGILKSYQPFDSGAIDGSFNKARGRSQAQKPTHSGPHADTEKTRFFKWKVGQESLIALLSLLTGNK
jgi:hypothetical protein